ncbi:MAG: UDP-N-acetylmuramoylalanine--D-glutamate ligase [Candidatus Saccharibacteria bacterium]|nr:UDP-N-acetylmuramoylalanine--D-glutamate ligase [Candidatus Saccharibacteria bacterium]
MIATGETFSDNSGMRVAILGYGAQGEAAFKYWSQPDNQLTICDADEQVRVPVGAVGQLGKDYLGGLGEFDLLVRGPSVHPADILAANDNDATILSKVTTVTNEFFKICPSKNIIGVTGTKGKGTTSTLIAKILEAVGKRVHLGGNIGTPPLSMLEAGIQPNDYIVLELANFQLIDLKYSPGIAVCLMVVPEHLNWHANMEEYVTAKQQLFRWQKPEDLAVYNHHSAHSAEIAGASPARKIVYDVPPPTEAPSDKSGAYVYGDTIYMATTAICNTDEVALLGHHNLENICAAIAATWELTSHDVIAPKKVITSFAGLEHRLQLVREIDGVAYYDDSFGTTPETAMVAIQAFVQPKICILGGSDKGSNYDELAHVVATSNVRAVIAIGDQGPKIAEALKTAGYTNIIEGGDTMADIVAQAKGAAHPGDVVLLSTGCASFGMFKNYKDRAEQFQAAVKVIN